MYDEAHDVGNNLFQYDGDEYHLGRVPKTLPRSVHLQELQLQRGVKGEQGISFRVQMRGLQSMTGQVHLTAVLILHGHRTHWEQQGHFVHWVLMP